MSAEAKTAATQPPQFVTGVDIGATLSRITQLELGRKMPIVQRNSLSNEATPSCVSFPAGEIRQFGEGAVAKELSRPANTVGSLHDLIAADAISAARLAKRGSGVSDQAAFVANGGAVTMGTDGEDEAGISSERLLAFALDQMLSFGSTGGSRSAQSIGLVISGGVADGAKARTRLQSAAVLCGFKPEQVLLVDDTVAAAVYFHHLQQDNIPAKAEEGAEQEEQHAVIVNVGNRTSSATYVKAYQGSVTVISQASLPIGSSQIDEAVAQHIFTYVKDKKKLDVQTHPKSHNKVLREAKKTKEMLSTTDTCSISIESLKDDTDVQMSMKRIELENLIQDVLLKPLEEMLTTKLGVPAEVKEGGKLRVEAIGGGWRAPCVTNVIKSALGCSRVGVSLDSNLAIAEGAAIWAAVQLAKTAPALAEGETSPFHGCHSVEVTLVAPLPEYPSADETVVAKWLEQEKALIEADDVLKARLAAKDQLESFIFQRREILPNVQGLPAETKTQFEEKLNKEEEYIWDDCEGADRDTITARFEALKKEIDSNEHIDKYFEAEREIQRQKDAELERLSKLQAEDKELKTDPQRLRGAQSRREQGQTLFKQEHFEDARTRFVQALTILGQLYDPTAEETAAKKKEIALSCHLNIASCSIKTTNWKVASNNASSALEYDANNAKAYFRRGQAKRQLHDFKGSRADLEKAKELTNGDAGVVAEIDALTADETREKANEKKMFGKMFA